MVQSKENSVQNMQLNYICTGWRGGISGLHFMQEAVAMRQLVLCIATFVTAASSGHLDKYPFVIAASSGHLVNNPFVIAASSGHLVKCPAHPLYLYYYWMVDTRGFARKLWPITRPLPQR